jgi:hypothetical protein
MNKFTLISLCFLLTGCAAEKRMYLPDITVTEVLQEQTDCSSVFPQGEWQFVHSIDFTRPSGEGTTVVGITTLSNDMIKSALVTVEGLTLFEADFFKDNSFSVHRAVPPFDSSGFAEGMMHDIRAIFQPPEGDMIQKGRIPKGIAICRYTDAKGWVTDILPNIDDCWQITSYTPDRIMNHSITGRSCIEKGSARIPEYLELQTYGMTGYTLKMTLLRADILQ